MLHPECSRAAMSLALCDNTCRKEGFKFYQLVAVVTEEGGKARTINLCKQCYTERRLKRGERPVTTSKWREMVEQTAFGGRVWAAFDMEHLVRKMWESFTLFFFLKKNVGQICFGRSGKGKAERSRRRLATGDAVQTTA